jgi:preprotein translocase subunit SecE
MTKRIKNLFEDFKQISWAKPKTIFEGLKDVLIFSLCIGGLCALIDFVASLIIKGLGV